MVIYGVYIRFWPTRAPNTQAPLARSHARFLIFSRFVASLAFHEGALVANYPLDGYPDGSLAAKRVKQPAPDDAAFVYLSQLYAQGHKTMAKSKVGLCLCNHNAAHRFGPGQGLEAR